jgi:filamentous hemagglutinin family protein
MKQAHRTARQRAQAPFSPHPLTLRMAHAFTRQTVAGTVFVAVGLSAPWSFAAPQDAKVVAGQATVQQSGSTTTVTQGSPRAAIDWRSFNVGATESVNFVQPNANSATLNRVTGADPSAIFGRITANGQVLLINPNGIVFGRTAQVDVGSLVASTANISNANFMAGKMEFTEPGKPGATVENHGSITVGEGGFAALVGRGVSNSGVINARLGKVSLAAGDAFVLDLYGDQLVNLVVDPAAMATDAAGTPLAARVDHSGSISADGGKVQLTAATVKRLVDNVINVSGVVRATSFETAPGRISLKGDANTSVAVSGSLETSGHSGGRIEVTGRDVTLASAATLAATGSTTGGSVSVGGDWQGKGPLLNAKQVSIETGARIDASATGQGNGGTVAIWSDDRTRFEGNIAARGGAAGGAGGNVEVSSKGQLGFLGDVDVFAANGSQGSVLLDPANLRIGTVSSGDSEISAEQIRFLLTRGASVTLTADQNVTVDAEVNGLVAGGVPRGGLTLTAGDNLTVNKNILLNDGALNLSATRGTLSSAAGTLLYTGNGAVNLRGGAGVNVDRVLSGGAVDIRSAGGGVTVRNAIVAATASGAAAPAASVLIEGAGVVTLHGVLANGDATMTSTLAGIALNGGTIESRVGDVKLDAKGGNIAGHGARIGLKAGGNVTAIANGAINLDVVIAAGSVALASTGAVNMGQAIDSGGLTISAGGPVALHGAKSGAGGMTISSRSGNVTSDGSAGGLLSTGSVEITASGGLAGTANQRLNVGAASGSGTGGQLIVEGRDGVFADSLLTEGSVTLRSSAGAVDVRNAIAGHSAASLAEATAVRELLIVAAGDVRLAGAKVGPGGLTVRGYNSGVDSAAKSFTLEGGTALSSGAINVTTSGPITIGTGGIQIVSAGASANLKAGGPIQMNGDIDLKAGTISLISDGSITALVDHPGADPNASDASLNAGRDDVSSKIVVSSKSGSVTLGGMVAQSDIKIDTKNGNVVLLNSLGGETTGYQNYDKGYQVALRPEVGRLEITAACSSTGGTGCGSVELNGLNLDGNRNPIDSATPGLKVTADHTILSNKRIAVNKGDISLAGGNSLPTDGVYLGDAVYSRGWDSVGADGQRGSQDDIKIGYGISVTGKTLGLIDNTNEYATVATGTTLVAIEGALTRTDSLGYLVDVSGARLSPLQVVSLDLSKPSAPPSLKIYNLDATGRIIGESGNIYNPDPSATTVQINGLFPTRVRGEEQYKDVAKIVISNNGANYQSSGDTDRLVPHSKDPTPQNEISILVDRIAGVGDSVPSSGKFAIGTFSPTLVSLGSVPTNITGTTGVTATAQGIGLKVLGFEEAKDTDTIIWGSLITLGTSNGSNGFQQLYLDPLISNGYRPSIALPIQLSGRDFTITAPPMAYRKYTVLMPDGSLQVRYQEAGRISRVGGVEVGGIPGSLNWRFTLLEGNVAKFQEATPIGDVALPAPSLPIPDLNLGEALSATGDWKFGRDPSNFSNATVRYFASPTTGKTFTTEGSITEGIRIQGELFSQSNLISASPTIQVGIRSNPALTELFPVDGQITFVQRGSTITRENELFNASRYLLVGGVAVETSADGSVTPAAPGTRVFIFDGTIKTLFAGFKADAISGVIVPGLGASVLGTNNSATGFGGVGQGFALVGGGTGSVNASTTSAGTSAGFLAPEVSDAGSAASADRLNLDLVGAGLVASQPDLLSNGNNVVIGQRPSAQADLGRAGGVAGSAINVSQRRYRLANSVDPSLCAPDAIQAAASTSADSPQRECK